MTDNLTPEQRSYCMSRIKGKNTRLEHRLRTELETLDLQFETHVKGLPGKPDIVFRQERIAGFVDGDFWHGYRFPAWEQSMSAFWREKIGKTRQRDRRNFKKLRRMGWRVIRIWQHEVKKDTKSCVTRITSHVAHTHTGLQSNS
jgi:DNA mismatch endonuclease (patch repair protein)